MRKGRKIKKRVSLGSRGAAMGCIVCVAILFVPGIAWSSVTDFSFGQLDWYDENQNMLVQNSSWGYMEMDVTADPTNVQYFNLTANAGSGSVWLVENMPIFPTSVSSYIRQGVDFNITEFGISEGTSLSSLDYSWSVGSSPVTTEVGLPAGTSGSAEVGIIMRQASGAKLGGVLTADIGAPAGHKARAGVGDAIGHKNVPAVQEDENRCLAGAFARSLGWLNQKYNLNHPRTAQEIYEDLVALKIGSYGAGATTYEEDIIAKHNYFRGMTKDAKTKILDVSDLINLGADLSEGLQEVANQDLVDWLYEELPTEDVELHYDTHIITLTGIYEQDGKTYVKYRDDETQDDDSKGDTAEKRGILSPAFQLPDGSLAYSFRIDGTNTNFQIKAAVSESVPEPGTICLFGLGGLALRRKRRA